MARGAAFLVRSSSGGMSTLGVRTAPRSDYRVTRVVPRDNASTHTQKISDSTLCACACAHRYDLRTRAHMCENTFV